MNNKKKKVSVFWFRRDLRFHDNHGLYRALMSGMPVLPVLIFDANILDQLPEKDDRRVNFIHKVLREMNKELLQHESSLYVAHGRPLDEIRKICAEYDVKAIYTNHDYEPYAIERDKEVFTYLFWEGIPFHSFKDQVIFEKDDITRKDGSPYEVFTPYSKAWKEKYFEEVPATWHSAKYYYRFFHTTPFHFPSLAEIGFTPSLVDFPPAIINKDVIRKYDLTRNFPALNGTSHLSVHLRFGTVSIRKVVADAVLLNEQYLNELIWREFFMMILFHYPHVVQDAFKKRFDNIQWHNNEEEFERWCHGETGYPLVDAGMRELNKTGFMHNRVRMVVASFLIKHLLIDWRWGEAYFAEKLLDYELSSNNGNWQWAAGSGCDAAPYFRIFNPTEQAKRFDPQNAYINKWLGKNYMIEPMVEHRFARQRTLDAYKKALLNSRSTCA
jgi:deoxyribodipyrimidine photo-lyase